MIAADSDAVRHSRFVDKRLNYRRLLRPLLQDPPNTEMDFNEISKTLPKFSLTAANALISSFGPGAVEMQELLFEKSPLVKSQLQEIIQ